MTDIVSIRDLRVSTVIGVYDWEREIEQALIFSVDLAADVARAAARDDIKDALDYSAVAHTVKTVVIEGKFQLIETAAERVAQRLLADYGAAWVRVEVVKPIPSEGYTAAISIERGRVARPMAKTAILSGAQHGYSLGDDPPSPPGAPGETAVRAGKKPACVRADLRAVSGCEPDRSGRTEAREQSEAPED